MRSKEKVLNQKLRVMRNQLEALEDYAQVGFLDLSLANQSLSSRVHFENPSQQIQNQPSTSQSLPGWHSYTTWKKKLTGIMTSQWHKWRHKWESDWWILSLLSTWICFEAINLNCSSFIWNYDIIMSHIRLFMISPSSLISPSATPRSSSSSDDSFAKSSSVKSISSEFTKVAVLTSVEIISLFSSKSSLRSVTF